MDQGTLKSLATVRRQYYQLVEPRQLRWPAVETLKAAQVQSLIFDDFFDMERNRTLPPDRYRLRVLKALIAKTDEIYPES